MSFPCSPEQAMTRRKLHRNDIKGYRRSRPEGTAMLSVDKRLLGEIMRKNRVSLDAVPSWISDVDYQNSIFRYGLPPHVRSFIDGYIGDETTYSDIIAY